MWEDPGGPGVALEPDQETADDPLGGADDEQFVVDRGWIVWIVEQVADADQHLPLRAPESKRQRLIDLQIEASVETGLRQASAPARESRVQFVEYEHVRGGFRNFGPDRGRQIVHVFVLRARESGDPRPRLAQFAR